MPPRAPLIRQLVGLGITLAAVAVFSAFTLRQISGLRELQTNIVERNRRDTLQLIRIQSDLNFLGLAIREMSENGDPYPLIARQPRLEQFRSDLDDAIRQEAALAPATRPEGQQALLKGSFDRFWSAADRLWQLAAEGREREARQLLRTRLSAELATMTSTVSRLLVQNDEAEAAAARGIENIYLRVERNIYIFVAAVLLAIAATGAYVFRFNRRMFQTLAELSENRRELAGHVISLQEDLFQTLARELHDDFGQVLTALGAMLQRVKKKLPPGSPVLTDLQETGEIAQGMLERVRGLSQMLHPPILDDYGLEKSIEWYIGQFQKQTGMLVAYEKMGTAPWIAGRIAIHVYRILQEALNNVLRHARTGTAQVRVRYSPEWVELVVEDHGAGMPSPLKPGGIGLIAMRERAGLMNGTIEFTAPPEGGTRVTLRVPIKSGEKV
jgi:signal transduction histidine kinase